MKKLYLLLLLLSLAFLVACAPQQKEVAQIPMYKETLIEDLGPC